MYSTSPHFVEAEHLFLQCLHWEGLDQKVARDPLRMREFEDALEFALNEAFHSGEESEESHRFLHRVLYAINRMKLFWYDDLDHYINENSAYLFAIRNRIESAWQDWENKSFAVERFENIDANRALKQRVMADLERQPSAEDVYIQKEMGEAGYRRLIEIASVGGLVEASQLSRMLGGVGNEVQSMLTRIFLEEYGGGRLNRKHSSFFLTMLETLGLDTRPEAYLDRLPWQVLANINLSFTLCEQKRNFLRYIGGLLYFETSAPLDFGTFKLAGERLGLPYDAWGYWDIHVKEDERHGRWMLDDVALPLIERYPDRAWQMVFGYDEQKRFNERAGRATLASIQKAETD